MIVDFLKGIHLHHNFLRKLGFLQKFSSFIKIFVFEWSLHDPCRELFCVWVVSKLYPLYMEQGTQWKPVQDLVLFCGEVQALICWASLPWSVLVPFNMGYIMTKSWYIYTCPNFYHYTTKGHYCLQSLMMMVVLPKHCCLASIVAIRWFLSKNFVIFTIQINYNLQIL